MSLILVNDFRHDGSAFSTGNAEQIIDDLSVTRNVEMRFPLCLQNQWLVAIDFGDASMRRFES